MFISKTQTNLRKVIAIMLSVVLMLMQLPMSVFAQGLPEVSNEVLTLENSVTVTAETKYAFTPEESGVYCFYSIAKNTDPVARLYDANEKQLAMDDDGAGELNFELNYYLEAGVTYYIVADAYDDKFSYTLAVMQSDLESIEIISCPAIEVYENDMMMGEWRTSYDGQIVDRYFRYYPDEQIQNAVIRVNYKGGSSEEITYFDENEEWSGISYEWDFCKNPWKAGSDNQLYITYKGLKAIVPVTVKASPVKSMELVSTLQMEFIEHDTSVGGWTKYYSGLELDERYFLYYYENFCDSIVLSVTYEDDTTEEVAVYNENKEPTGIGVYSDQYKNPWTIGGENEFEIWYKGACITSSATVVESPVESLALSSGGDFEYTEFDENYGHWMGDIDSGVFYYFVEPFMQNIALTVTYKGGATEEVPYYNEEGMHMGISYLDDQHDKPWTADGENYIEVCYKGASVKVPVTVKPGIIESISVGNITVVEGTHGSLWDHETQAGLDSWYHYNIDPTDITVKLTTGEELKGNQYYISEQLGTYIRFIPEEEQFYENPWGVGEYKVTASIMGKTAEFTYTIEKSNIKSISVSDVTIEQYKNGGWQSGYWNDYGEWIEDEWFYYDLVGHEITVIFEDDSTFVGTADEYGNLYGEYPIFATYQDYNNQWKAGGTYTAKAFIGGRSCDFSVTVAETNITGIQVIDTQGFVYLENDTNYGSWSEDGTFIYNAYELVSRITLRVTYKDTTTEDITFFDESGMPVGITYFEDQYETPWSVGGENLITITYCGIKTTISATIEKSPIESIVVDNITYTQFTGGYWESNNYWDGDILVDGEDYYYYYAYPQHMTVTFTEGETVSGTFDEVSERIGIRAEIFSNQHSENQWGVGTHTVTLSLLGVTAQYTVTIEESLIESITAQPIEYIEGTNGYWQEYYDQNNTKGYYYYYNFPLNDIIFTITYKEGGTVITGNYSEIEAQTGISPEVMIPQGYDNQWCVGTHKGIISYMGAVGEIDVNIIPSNVESISAEPIEHTEGTNGYWQEHWVEGEAVGSYYHYSVIPQIITVTFTDAPTFTGTIEELYEATGYYVSTFSYQDYNNQWGIGNHTATIAFMGKTADIEVTISASPIESITVEDVYIEEGTNGYWYPTNDGSYYLHYDIRPQNITITYTNEPEFSGSYDEVSDHLGSGMVSFGSDQNVDNQWGVGTHTATVDIMGVTVEYNVIIEETNVESITVYPIIAVSNKDGWTNTQYYDEQQSQWFDGEWYEYHTQPEMMVVTFKDGTVYKGDLEGFYGYGYSVRFNHDQSYFNPWQTGVHNVTMQGAGFSVSYNVEIVEEIESGNYCYAVLSDGTAVITEYASYYDAVIPETIDGYTVTVIASNLLQYDSITSLTIPSSIKRIENYAFYYCNDLATVRIYSTEAVIGAYAFENCVNLERVVYYGTQQQAEQMDILRGNEWLTSVEWKYAADCTEHEYDDACDAECNVCFTLREAPHAFEWIIDYDATCVDDGCKHERCALCDAVRSLDTVIPAKGEHTNTELLRKEEATCGRWGYTGDLYCHDCNTYVTTGESVEPTGNHINTQVTGNYDATCGNWGYTGDTHCLDCGQNIVVGEMIEPTGNHQNTGLTGDYDATCGAEGYTGDIYCYDCGNILSLGETIPAKGHQNTYLQGACPATCGSAGYTGNVVCSDCGSIVQYGQEIPATNNHTYDSDYDADCNTCGAVREVTSVPPALSLSGGAAYQGETIRLDVRIDGNTGFSALQFGLIYDKTYLTLKDVESQMEGFNVTVDNSIVFDAVNAHTSNGVIATLVFEVAEDAPIGSYDVQLRFMSASSDDFKEVVMTDTAATITVESAVLGDANGDGEVTTVDLSMLRKYLAYMDPTTMTSDIEVKRGADTNGDGVVDTVDLAYVRQYLASMPVA